MDNIKEQMIEKLKNHNLSLIAYNENEISFSSTEKGILPIARALSENRNVFVGKNIVDKVIGRAAALLLIQAKINSCHAIVISKTAIDAFEKHSIPFTFETTVDAIQNMTKTDLCPLEKLATTIEKADDSYEKIFEFVKHRL